MRDWKYLLAYLLPLSAIPALYLRGFWTLAPFLLAFVLIPLIEIWTPASTWNYPKEAETTRSRRIFFELLLYLNAPLLYGIVGAYLYVSTFYSLPWPQWLALTLGVGIIIGANGINVAHELGHRPFKFEQWLAQAMLLPALYQHFFIEHNRGHHKDVATLADPATAQFGENLYAFLMRSSPQTWQKAWKLEKERLEKAGLPFWSAHNLMLRFQIVQLVYLIALGVFGGWKTMPAAVAVAAIGFTLLETINYIEHYGLLRRTLPSGRPEPVLPVHSWNSNHALGRIFLYELTRHSDHHYKASRKYQVLRHMDDSPQLPFGYPTGILLALCPPLWFRIMNPRAQAARDKAGI